MPKDQMSAFSVQRRPVMVSGAAQLHVPFMTELTTCVLVTSACDRPTSASLAVSSRASRILALCASPQGVRLPVCECVCPCTLWTLRASLLVHCRDVLPGSGACSTHPPPHLQIEVNHVVGVQIVQAASHVQSDAAPPAIP